MTKSELREAIKAESRIKTGATLDSLVDSIVADIITDYCNLTQPYELLKEGIEITVVDGQQSYSLPADFAALQTVRYGRGPTPIYSWRVIAPQVASVAQTNQQGLPKFYRLVQGPKISFWPYGNFLATDTLVIDYFINPMSIYVADIDPFPVPRLESTVKKDAIARVQRFYSSSTESQMTAADGRASFNSFDATTK